MANITECDKCYCLSRGAEPGIEDFTHVTLGGSFRGQLEGEGAISECDLCSKCLKQYKEDVAALGKKYCFVIKEEE